MASDKLKIDPEKVKYDGRTFKLIIKDEEEFKKELLRKQAEILKDIEETGGPQ